MGKTYREGYHAGYRACETRLAPAVRLAEAYSVCRRDGTRELQDALYAADDAYRASKPQPARDPLEEAVDLATTINHSMMHMALKCDAVRCEVLESYRHDWNRVRDLLAQAMERRAGK